MVGNYYKKERNKMINTVSKLLSLDATILIGSYGLEVSNEKSNMDICIYYLDLIQSRLDLGKPMIIYPTPASDNFLLLKYSEWYHIPPIDVFVFKDRKKLSILSQTMSQMRRYPKFLLKNKWIRTKIFIFLLKRNGFTNEDTTK
jgi:hypothetical protein